MEGGEGGGGRGARDHICLESGLSQQLAKGSEPAQEVLT